MAFARELLAFALLLLVWLLPALLVHIAWVAKVQRQRQRRRKIRGNVIELLPRTVYDREAR